ncbi:NPC intracellular cholesterol transporter 1 homolog 1b-like [Epargyreus clarus]|uniref:NPC intracellular cholesterol transporter 1 homolog 1b-like n=1 Tax=Epargyreus clarus TaxID=520877 RepID=UPI003C2C5E77
MTLGVVILTILYLCCGVYGKCVMRSECIEIGGFPKPCPYYGDPLPVLRGLSQNETQEVLRIIEGRCPHLLTDEEGNVLPEDEILTCCDKTQLNNMHASLLLADGVLGRCPTCLRNFARQICEMNCSPDQARFVNVTEEIAPDGTAYVNEINYRVFNDFMIDAHQSCSGVLVPQTGLPAINLMCGNAPVCDADAWFGFTGDTQNNPLAPVQVNFHRWPTPHDSMNVRAPPCNESFEGDLPCSCVDCRITCPTGNEPVIQERCTVFSINCIGFSVGLVLFVITVVIFIIIARIEFVKLSKNVSNQEVIIIPRVKGLTKFFQWIFSLVGGFSARNPVLIIMMTSWVIFSMLFGVLNLNISSNPLELWSAPESRSRHELNYFNSRFGPFYRAAQVYLQFRGLDPFQVGNITYGPAFRIEALRELVTLENAIKDIGRDNGGVTLEQVCYAPLRRPGTEQSLDQCVSMSATVYLGDDKNNINNETYLNTIQNCLNNYLSFNCMASWGGGAEPEIAFGGFDGDNILSADTLLINFPITNFLLEEDLRPVLEWEQKFIDLLHDYEDNWKPDFIHVAFGAERSIEDEIQRVSQAEAIPISISYILMFVYVILALGNIRKCRTLLIDSKVTVAVGSLLVVIAAIFCALGMMGYIGYTLTLLALNVIPFFILSVGIDNVFLMVNTLQEVDGNLKEYDDYKEDFSFERKKRFVFEKMMYTVGPSMFVSSVTQITCFAIGSLANFPAVVTFAIFASFSLGFLFVFQITTVVAILALDYTRSSQNRLDVFCCVRKKILDDDDPLTSNTPYQSVTSRLMVPYSRFLLDFRVKIVVAIIFMGMFCASIILIPQIEIGLDQELALPPDSYVYRYLQAVNELLRLGPPVYFVLKSGLNFTDPVHQNTICGGQLCNNDSLTTQIFLASLHSEITHISRSSNSWIDDFFDWASLPDSCCKFNNTDNSFCPSYDTSLECSFCSIQRSDFANGLRPAGEAFEKYIPFFLRDTPTETCNKGGLASYFSNVNYLRDSDGRAAVYDTNFMAYHVALSTSKDYITAVKYGYEVSENITAAIKKNTGLDVEVFPYSVFYVFYEQYLTMWKDTFASVGFCLIGAFVINLIASGFNFLTTFAMMVTIIMVVVDMMGVMYIWNIPLNAVSCVNLIVSIGIAVEFCSHIAYAFATSSSPPQEKVADALKRIGSTVITGITLTNIPIIVLAFSYTEIIEVFFFRMLFSLVILGFLHGMVFFPVFLSYLNNLRL